MASPGLKQAETKPIQNTRPNLFNSNSTKNIPTYLDEFKHGFPSNGLSSVSNSWWRSSSSNDIQENIEEGTSTERKEQREDECRETVKEEIISEEIVDTCSDESVKKGAAAKEDKTEVGEKNELLFQGEVVLSSLRKRAAEEGREALKVAAVRGNGPYKLNSREQILLSRVFQSFFPAQWR